jgi:hypothetical protein
MWVLMYVFSLLSQPGRYERQGGMEAPSDRGVSGILERRAMQVGQVGT